MPVDGQPPQVPVLQPADAVIADLCLAADGLLAHPDPVGGAVPPRAGRTVSVTAPRDLAALARAAGRLMVADAESAPVVELAVQAGADTGGGDVVLTGTATPAPRVPSGVGQQLRVSYAGRPTPGHVVVLERPLLSQEEALLAVLPEPVQLLVPIGGPSPDAIPAASMLRLAEHSADRIGAQVVTATLVWRDPDSDANLAAQVAAGLCGTGPRGGSLVHHRSARTLPDQPWTRILQALREDTDLPPGLPADAVEVLRAWRPPRAERGLVVFFTGLSGAGKSTLARLLADHVAVTGERTVSLLDGDEVRRLLSAGLGFDAAGRDLNIRRIGWVAAQIARHGGMAVCAPIAPYEDTRQVVRHMVEEVGDFVLVHVATSLADCEARDVKGLYARARAGQITGFTGIDDPYEVPPFPDLTVDTAGADPRQSLDGVLTHLRAGGWLR